MSDSQFKHLDKWFESLSSEEKKEEYRKLDEAISKSNREKTATLAKDKEALPKLFSEIKELNNLFKLTANSIFIDGDFAYRVFLPFKPQVMFSTSQYTVEFVKNEIEHMKKSMINSNSIGAYIQEEDEDGIYLSIRPSNRFIEETKDYKNKNEYADFVYHWQKFANIFNSNITFEEIAYFIDEESYKLHKMESACRKMHILLAIHSTNDYLVKLQGEFNISRNGFNPNVHLEKWIPQTKYIFVPELYY